MNNNLRFPMDPGAEAVPQPLGQAPPQIWQMYPPSGQMGIAQWTPNGPVNNGQIFPANGQMYPGNGQMYPGNLYAYGYGPQAPQQMYLPQPYLPAFGLPHRQPNPSYMGNMSYPWHQPCQTQQGLWRPSRKSNVTIEEVSEAQAADNGNSTENNRHAEAASATFAQQAVPTARPAPLPLTAGPSSALQPAAADPPAQLALQAAPLECANAQGAAAEALQAPLSLLAQVAASQPEAVAGPSKSKKKKKREAITSSSESSTSESESDSEDSDGSSSDSSDENRKTKDSLKQFKDLVKSKSVKKRGPGRPPGSKNKATLAREAKEQAKKEANVTRICAICLDQLPTKAWSCQCFPCNCVRACWKCACDWWDANQGPKDCFWCKAKLTHIGTTFFKENK